MKIFFSFYIRAEHFCWSIWVKIVYTIFLQANDIVNQRIYGIDFGGFSISIVTKLENKLTSVINPFGDNLTKYILKSLIVALLLHMMVKNSNLEKNQKNLYWFMVLFIVSKPS